MLFGAPRQWRGFPAGKSIELFRPFARLHNVADLPGTGIGLTTVHRAVARHAGEIQAEGQDGRGDLWFTRPAGDRSGPSSDASGRITRQ